MTTFLGDQKTAVEPSVEPAKARRKRLGNRSQVLLFALLTVILTGVTVWGTRAWLKHSVTLTFAAGAPGSIETRFAEKLAAVLAANSPRLRLTILPNPDRGKALARFDRRQADLAILRTDATVPGRARTVAILEHDVLLLISKRKKIASLAALKGQKIAIPAADDSNEAFLRNVLKSYDIAPGNQMQTVPVTTPFDKLLGTDGYGVVATVEHASRISRDKNYEQFARRAGGFILNPVSGAKAIERKFPGVASESLEKGILSASPAIPDDDLETIGLQWLLVAQSKLPETTVVELARTLFENKSALALEDGFGSKIEPADTDKDAFVIAHPGAAQYINDETKSFAERYSDLMYLALAAASIIGSLFAGLFAAVTRTPPENAGKLATAVLDIADRVNLVDTIDAIAPLQDELEAVLRRVLTGIRDGKIKRDGLEAFRLAFEFVRDTIESRREYLIRRGNHDGHVTVMKSAAHGA